MLLTDKEVEAIDSEGLKEIVEDFPERRGDMCAGHTEDQREHLLIEIWTVKWIVKKHTE